MDTIEPTGVVVDNVGDARGVVRGSDAVTQHDPVGCGQVTFVFQIILAGGHGGPADRDGSGIVGDACNDGSPDHDNVDCLEGACGG